MKKLLAVCLFAAAFLLVSCGASDDVVGKPAGPMKKIAVKTDPKIYSLFGDLYTGSKIQEDNTPADPNSDTRIYLWNAIKMYIITNADDNPAGGNTYRHFVVQRNVDTWFGWGVHSAPATYRNMSGFENGHLKFWIRVKDSNVFKVGVKHGFTTESWMNIEEGKYGYVKDGKWHQVSIPLADFFPKINFRSVNIWYMMAQGIGALPKPGAVYDITEMYWTKD